MRQSVMKPHSFTATHGATVCTVMPGTRRAEKKLMLSGSGISPPATQIMMMNGMVKMFSRSPMPKSVCLILL